MRKPEHKNAPGVALRNMDPDPFTHWHNRCRGYIDALYTREGNSWVKRVNQCEQCGAAWLPDGTPAPWMKAPATPNELVAQELLPAHT